MTHYTFTDFDADVTLDHDADYYAEVEKDFDEDLLNGEEDLVAFFGNF